MPLMGTLVIALSLDHWHAPEWMWGAVGLLVICVWAVWIYEICEFDDDEIDIFSREAQASPHNPATKFWHKGGESTAAANQSRDH